MQAASVICVVGSINVDLVFRTPRMPLVGETLSGYEFIQVAGGKGANQAVAAARLGAETTLIASVGTDSYGQQSILGLKRDNIHTQYINTMPTCATGTAGILVDDQGNNCIVIAPGANAKLKAMHVRSARPAICNAQVLICQCEVPLETSEAAIEMAHQHQVKVVFNPAPMMDLPDAVLEKIDYLILNETEAGQMSGTPVSNQDQATLAAKKLLEKGIQCVLVTLGEHGVIVVDQQGTQHVPAVTVSVVDTTAAGDTFVGAFANYIAQGMSTVDATREAQYCAALTVTKLGAQSSIPTRDEVEKFKHSLGV